MNTVINLSLDQYNSACILLSKAFANYPLFKWIFPKSQYREQILPWYLGMAIRDCLQHGNVYTTTLFEGVSAWSKKGETDAKLQRLASAGLFQLPFRIGLIPFIRVLIYGKTIESIKAQNAPKSHWYLSVLGVDPIHQRRGIGCLLLEPILKKASQSDLHCYLETHDESNLPFYKNNGFEIVHEGVIRKNGPKIWAMLRPP